MQKSSGYRKELGAWGEAYACEYLQKKGYQLIASNFRHDHGEIDLLMRIDDLLIAVEVKTRRSNKFGYGEDSVTNRKLRTIYKTMTGYLMEHPELPNIWQLDVVVVEPVQGEAPVIYHYENVSFEGIC